MSFHNGLVCVLKCDHGKTHGIVFMTNHKEGVVFQIYCKDLPEGLKGFHVHEKGNLVEFCKTLGPHYNPTDSVHGGLNTIPSHKGDLGNIYINQYGRCEMELIRYDLTLEELLGRSLVIHGSKDDLGKGMNQESLQTGNSGKRICCGVIGYA